MKSIRCCDLGFTCEYHVEAETEDDLLQRVAEHAIATHHLTVTPELVTQVKQKIRE